MPSVLANITVLEKRLAKAKTVEEAKKVAKQADVVATAARSLGAHRSVVNQAVRVLIDAKCFMGQLLGPAKPKAGPGRGKPSLADDGLSRQERRICRAACWKVDPEIRNGYIAWIDKREDDHLAFWHILLLSRLTEDLQSDVLTELQTGAADSLREAIRNVKRRKIVEGEATVPVGEYRCLIVDPPWPMQKIEREHTAPAQGQALDYSTMSLDEIKAYALPAADECHCYLWTTQRFLPASFEILEAWTMKYVFTMVWHKAGGFQPVNLPQYNCEFVVFGRRGGLGFLDTKDFPCCFDGKRREHSRKPTEFYDLVRRVSPAPRYDVFSREAVEGFEQGGMQTEHFDE